jgi:hypothetical protein
MRMDNQFHSGSIFGVLCARLVIIFDGMLHYDFVANCNFELYSSFRLLTIFKCLSVSLNFRDRVLVLVHAVF